MTETNHILAVGKGKVISMGRGASGFCFLQDTRSQEAKAKNVPLTISWELNRRLSVSF